MIYRGKPSPGCELCRKRRLRCDRRVPSCSQCLRVHQECSGYRDPQSVRFYDQSAEVVSKAQAKAQCATGRNIKKPPTQQSLPLRALMNPSSPDEQKPIPYDIPYDISFDKQHGLLLFFPATLHRSPSPPLETAPKHEPVGSLRIHAIPQAANMSPMIRDQICSGYLTTFCYGSGEYYSNVDRRQFILTGIAGLPYKSQMLEEALAALSCIFVGKFQSDDQTLRYGLRLYNSAIQKMSMAINRKSYSDDLIYTCFIFQQIQIHYCPSSLAEWLAHFDGLSAIMKCYRPKSFTNPIIATIYGPSRDLSIVLESFMHHSAETIEVLRKPKGDGVLEELIVYMAELSRIAAAVDNADPSDRALCLSLLEDTLNVEAGARDLGVKINHGFSGDPPVYGRGELKTRVPPTDDYFGPAYRFRSLEDATLRILFWLLLSFTHPLICYCQSLTSDKFSTLAKMKEPQFEKEANRLAAFYVGKAIRCLPYLGQLGMSPSGLHYGLLVAIQASRAYTHSRDYVRFLWAQELFSALQHAGFDYVGRFRDIYGAYWADSHKHNVFRLVKYRDAVKKEKVI